MSIQKYTEDCNQHMEKHSIPYGSSIENEIQTIDVLQLDSDKTQHVPSMTS